MRMPSIAKVASTTRCASTNARGNKAFPTTSKFSIEVGRYTGTSGSLLDVHADGTGTLTSPGRAPVTITDDAVDALVNMTGNTGQAAAFSRTGWAPSQRTTPGTAPVVRAGGQEIELRRTYSDVRPGEYVALINSFGVLEVARAQQSAAEGLGLGRGAPIVVSSRHCAAKRIG